MLHSNMSFASAGTVCSIVLVVKVIILPGRPDLGQVPWGRAGQGGNLGYCIKTVFLTFLYRNRQFQSANPMRRFLFDTPPIP